jgi:predicted nuclease with RNAse H fold
LTRVRSLGIDVGGQRKKLDVVLLDDRLQPFPILSRVDVSDVGRLVRELRPDVVAIDSPPDWGPPGAGSRETERQLAMLGIRSFNTPGRDRGEGNPFYDWMQMGFEVFRAAGRAGFPRFDGRTVRGTAIEVFPHATETVLAGCLPPLGAKKKVWRTRLLQMQGVGVANLQTLDHVDAALAALTGLLALKLRQPFAPGIPKEGVIVLPTRVPPGPYARCDIQVADDTPTLIHFCACGCGAEVRPGREFRAGHDAKLKARLVRATREGDAARRELERRKWL